MRPYARFGHTAIAPLTRWQFRHCALALVCLPLIACSSPPSTPPASSQPPYRNQSSNAHRYRSERNREDSRQPQSDGRTGFDFYLLNLSWSPEFCAAHPDRAECAQHLGFVLHGLWPQNNDGSYPQHCTDAPGPQNPAAFKDLYPDTGLLRHEWETHGTCSGLAPDIFFATARSAMRAVVIPTQLSRLDHQTSMPPQAILGLFTSANPAIPRQSFALSCGNNYLTAIELCLDKDLHPVACQAVRSCRANTVRIPSP